jgi:hypothetical protein
MKRILYAILFLVFTSCGSNTKDNFRGFGELQIGSQFDSIPSRKLFEKISENHYQLNKYELTKSIGFVEAVDVYVVNNRIYEVNFNTGDYTKYADIRKCTSMLTETEFSKKNTERTNQIIVKEYTTENSEITLKKSIYAMINSIEICYFNTIIKEKIDRENTNKEDSIKKSEYLKDVKQL